MLRLVHRGGAENAEGGEKYKNNLGEFNASGGGES